MFQGFCPACNPDEKIASKNKTRRGNTFCIFEKKKNVMRKITAVLGALYLLTSSCVFIGGKRIRGNGVIKTENRQTSNFHRIDASGSVDVYVRQDSVYSIKVEADENLLPYVIVQNDNGSLSIHEKRGTRLRPTRSVKVYVSGPSIDAFEASGACDLVSENTITSNTGISINMSGASDIKMNVNAPKVKADVSGAGTITLKGQTKDLSIDGSGAATFRCYELLAENTSVDMAGAGKAEVFASVKLNADVSGAGSISYKGNPEVIKSISGAGSLNKVD